MADGFRFSFERVAEAEKDLDLQVSAIETYIDKIVKGIEIQGHPVIGYVLTLTHDQEDLERIGDACKKIAPHIKKLDDLRKRRGIFEMALQEPGWFQSAFGDFSSELETFITTQVNNESENGA